MPAIDQSHETYFIGREADHCGDGKTKQALYGRGSGVLEAEPTMAPIADSKADEEATRVGPLRAAQAPKEFEDGNVHKGCQRSHQDKPGTGQFVSCFFDHRARLDAALAQCTGELHREGGV